MMHLWISLVQMRQGLSDEELEQFEKDNEYDWDDDLELASDSSFSHESSSLSLHVPLIVQQQQQQQQREGSGSWYKSESNSSSSSSQEENRIEQERQEWWLSCKSCMVGILLPATLLLVQVHRTMMHRREQQLQQSQAAQLQQAMQLQQSQVKTEDYQDKEHDEEQPTDDSGWIRCPKEERFVYATVLAFVMACCFYSSAIREWRQSQQQQQQQSEQSVALLLLPYLPWMVIGLCLILLQAHELEIAVCCLHCAILFFALVSVILWVRLARHANTADRRLSKQSQPGTRTKNDMLVHMTRPLPSSSNNPKFQHVDLQYGHAALLGYLEVPEDLDDTTSSNDDDDDLEDYDYDDACQENNTITSTSCCIFQGGRQQKQHELLFHHYGKIPVL